MGGLGVEVGLASLAAVRVRQSLPACEGGSLGMSRFSRAQVSRGGVGFFEFHGRDQGLGYEVFDFLWGIALWDLGGVAAVVFEESGGVLRGLLGLLVGLEDRVVFGSGYVVSGVSASPGEADDGGVYDVFLQMLCGLFLYVVEG